MCARHSVGTQQYRRKQRTVEMDSGEWLFELLMSSFQLRHSSRRCQHLHSQHLDYCYWCTMANSMRSLMCFEELNIYCKFQRVSVAWDFHYLTLIPISAVATMLVDCLGHSSRWLLETLAKSRCHELMRRTALNTMRKIKINIQEIKSFLFMWLLTIECDS